VILRHRNVRVSFKMSAASLKLLPSRKAFKALFISSAVHRIEVGLLLGLSFKKN
jgi:hypothetical protein